MENRIFDMEDRILDLERAGSVTEKERDGIWRRLMQIGFTEPDIRARVEIALLRTRLDAIPAAEAAPDAPALPPSGAGGGQGTPMWKVLVRLHKQIEDSFSEEELRTLCFDIGVRLREFASTRKSRQS